MRKLVLAAASLLILGTLSAQAAERKFTVINKSKFAIHEIYATLEGDDKEGWGEDMLGEKGTLESGESTEITLTVKGGDDCTFDFKFQFEDDGDKDETNNFIKEDGLNVCKLPNKTYTITDEK